MDADDWEETGRAGDLVLRPGEKAVTVEDMAAECGIPAARIRRVLLAAGIPVGSDDRVPPHLDVLIAAFERGADLMGEDAILAFTRVLGAAAINVAEAAVALFYAELGPGTERAGSDELALARLSEEATRAFTDVPGVLAHLLLAQFNRATRRAVLARGWSLPADEQVEAGPSEVVALGFVDLVGFTAWTEELSLRDQSLALSRFESAAWSSGTGRGQGGEDAGRWSLLCCSLGGFGLPGRERSVPRRRSGPHVTRSEGSDRLRHGDTEGGRLLRPARQSGLTSGQGGGTGRAGAHRRSGCGAAHRSLDCSPNWPAADPRVGPPGTRLRARPPRVTTRVGPWTAHGAV